MDQNVRVVITAEGTTQTVNSLNRVNKGIGSVAKSLMGMAAAYFTVRQAMKIFNDSLANARTQDLAIKALNNSLANAGKFSREASIEMRSLASSLQAVSNFGDEDILKNVTTGLLRYRKISFDTYPRVQQLVLDIAEATGGSLSDSTKQLAVALEDPILGMTRLRRSGIIFSDSQQAVIKNLVETNKLAEAQGIILGEMESKFGGAAQAGVNSATQLKNAWGDYLEQLGMATEKTISIINQGTKSALAAMEQSLVSFNEGVSGADLNAKVRWANITSYVVLSSKAVVKTLGQTMVLIGSFVLDTADAIYKLFRNTFSGIKSLIIGMIQGFGAIIPAAMAALQGDFSQAGKIIADAFTDPFRDSTFFALDDFAINTTKAVNALGNTWKTYGEEVSYVNQRNLQDILNMQNAAQKLSGVLGLDDSEAGSSAAMDSGAAMMNKYTNMFDGFSKRLIAKTKQRYNDMLSAQLDYLQMTKANSQETINKQIELYTLELQAYRNLGFSKLQIDEMIAAKRKQLEKALQDETLQEWIKNNELKHAALENFINAFSSEMTNLLQIQNDTNNLVLRAFTSFINSMIAEISRLIAKELLALALFKLLGIGAGVGAGSLLGGLFPSLITPASAFNGGGTSSGSGIGSGTRSINYSPPAMQPQAPQVLVYTQVIEGVPFANAVNRAQRVANEL